MKKFTAILVCLLLVASLAVMAFAAEEVKYTLTADKTSVSRGDIVTYTIATNGIDNCKGVAMIIDYDKAVFEYVENSGTNNAPAGTLGFVQVSNNKLACSMTNMFSTFSISGEMFTLQLKVLDAAAFADSQVAIGDASYAAADKTTVAVEGNSVKMSIVCANHTPVTTTTKEATCEEAGEKVTSCSVCNAVIKTEPIAAKGHKWDNGTETTAPTCTAKGTKTFTCENGCGETKTEDIAALGHKWDNGTETKPATCSAEGEMTFKCENTGCTETKTEAIAKLAHTWDEGVMTKEMTCTEEGEVLFTCTVCDATEILAIDKLPHDFDEGVVTKEPTTKAEGEKTYTCKDCGATKTEAIAKLETPKTDDNSMILAFVLLMVLSAAGVAVTVIGKKRVA